MNQFDICVDAIIHTLREQGSCDSVISSHRVCYRELRSYLVENCLNYTFETALHWMDENKADWPKHKVKTFRRSIIHLDSFYRTGQLPPANEIYRHNSYECLCQSLRDDFLEIREEFISMLGFDEKYCTTLELECLELLHFAQKMQIFRIDDIDYSLFLKFHFALKESLKNSTRSRLESACLRMLTHFVMKGRVSLGFSLIYPVTMLDRIVTLPAGETLDDLPQGDNFIQWSFFENYLSELVKKNYSRTILGSHRFNLSLVYIFHERYRLNLSEQTLWKWYELSLPTIGSGIRIVKRVLKQFWKYVCEGIVVTATINDLSRVTGTMKLPEWSRNVLEDYISMLKREGWKKSTIDMHMNSNIRFCEYLQKIGVSSFKEVTAEAVRAFNAQDRHSTAEGKAAYNVRIRKFLTYLEERKLTSHTNLHLVLMSAAAEKVRIVHVLAKEDLDVLQSVDPSSLKGKSYRDYVMIMIGLTMGFRASDIVNLRYENIDWKRRVITITQKKTGKLISMPMPATIGNLLFRYLSEERPKSDSSFIFINHFAPFGSIYPSSCRLALRRFLPNRVTKGRGFHVVRKTFATELLRGNAGQTMIIDMLGHTTDDTIHKYLSLDDERMMTCPLSLTSVGLDLPGGLFNE